MPSPLHDSLVELVLHRPELVVDLLRDVLGIEVPAHDGIRLEGGQFSDVVPIEYRADAAVVLSGPNGPVLAAVVEVQLRRDGDKRWSWPVYLAILRARLRCPVVLLVLCVRQPVARWCAAPIDLGHPGWSLQPLVLGPERVPVIDTAAAATHTPEIAVLSALAHGADAEHRAVLDALVSGLSAIERSRALLYADVVLAALPAAARHYLEELMATGTHEYQSDFARRYYGEGRTEGRTEGRAEATALAVLRVLDTRRVPVPDDVRARIDAEHDLDRLDHLLVRAVVVTSAEELFA